MKKVRCMPIAALIILSAVPLSARAFPLSVDVDMLLLLAGPVSEAVQETVLLIRRGDNFITKDSLSIGCIAGASSGFMVGVAPILGFFETSVGAPPGVAYIVGTVLLSCAMSIAGSAVGMGTMSILHKWHEWRESPMLNSTQPNSNPKPTVDAKPQIRH